MSEPIFCFNGKECSYNIDTQCPNYEGNAEAGVCKAPRGEPAVDKPKRNIPQSTEPVQQTQVGGARNISSLKEGERSTKENPIKIKGFLVFDARTNNRTTKNGETTVTDLLLKDDTGEVKISFWGSNGGDVKDFKKGDQLFFEGLYKVDKPYDGKPQMTGGKYYNVAKLN